MAKRATSKRPLICVIDDDESVRESLPDLIREFSLDVRAFASAEEFLASASFASAKCLVLDVAMPGMNGPDLQAELKRQGRDIPIIFITAHTNDAVRSRVLKQGAVACLFKPFSDTALRDALSAALRPS
jgi:FixJ family two-component response regulator